MADMQLEDRITRFRSNPNHSKVKNCELLVSGKKRHTSVLDSYGVRVVDDKKDKWFRCCVGDCFNKETCIKMSKTSTSLATSHLKNAHNVVPDKTVTTLANMAALEKVKANSMPGFLNNPKRWFQVRHAFVF